MVDGPLASLGVIDGARPLAAATRGDVVSVKGLRKSYDDVQAVNGLDLTIAQGECFGLLGPNGAGKTTTLEILEGLLESSGGEVRIFGERWEDARPKILPRVGVALQETRLSERLSVEETLRLFRSFYKEGADIEALMAQLQLTEKRKAWVGKLSGGQRQRLAVACGVVGNPDLLFLDEPTTGLDPQSRRALWDILGTLKAQGRTIVLTTHYMDEAERLCDRIGIIDHGRMLALGTPRELIFSLGGAQVIELKTTPLLAPGDFASLPALNTRLQGDRLVVTAENSTHSLAGVLGVVNAKGAQLDELQVRQATLEDVFVKLTGRQLRDE